jgi:hypothetical protein
MINDLLIEVLRQILINQSIILDEFSHSHNLGLTAAPRAATVRLIGKIDGALENTDVRFNSEIDWQKGDTAVIKEGWDRAGIEFTVLGPAMFLEQWWVPVEDPDEEDPDFHKEAGLRKVK